MKYIYLFVLLFLPLFIFCQGMISGKVVSEKGEPLQGASVFIPNTTNGVLTGTTGEFTLANLAAGNTRIAISFVGYKTMTLVVTANGDEKPYTVTLFKNIHELEAVTIANYEKNGWRRWGELFTGAFIGASAYAEQCVIKNKDVINFIYTNATKSLHAYAAAPLILENRALGYRITVTMIDFIFNTETENVDYQVYSLFEEMTGSNEEQLIWKSNRESTYALSMMHFMRSVYAGTILQEGFELRRLEKTINLEKLRVQGLYKEQYSRIKDSLSSSQLKENALNKLIERSFKTDSLRYYRKILEQEDRAKKLHRELLPYNLITSRSDSNTVIFRFKDYLHVTYKKSKEPEEYFIRQAESSKPVGAFTPDPAAPKPQVSWPVSELVLEQGIPVEVYKNGYFTNIDLYVNGFWGWWEKMATKLPYGYEP